MKSKARMPGFTAAIVLEPPMQRHRYAEVQRGLLDQSVVTPQKSEFACGLALAAFLGGIALANPFAIIGGLGGITTQC